MEDDALETNEASERLNRAQQNGTAHLAEDWVAERANHALVVLRDCVELNPAKHGGVPVLRGTRFPISHVFAEMSEGLSIDQIAEDFELDRELLKHLLMGLSIHLDRPFAK